MIADYFIQNKKYKENKLFYIPISNLYKNLAGTFFSAKEIILFIQAYAKHLYYARKARLVTDYMEFLKLLIKLLLNRIKVIQ